MLQQDQENRPHRNEFVDLPTQSSADQEEDMMEQKIKTLRHAKMVEEKLIKSALENRQRYLMEMQSRNSTAEVQKAMQSMKVKVDSPGVF